MSFSPYLKIDNLNVRIFLIKLETNFSAIDFSEIFRTLIWTFTLFYHITLFSFQDKLDISFYSSFTLHWIKIYLDTESHPDEYFISCNYYAIQRVNVFFVYWIWILWLWSWLTKYYYWIPQCRFQLI